MASTSVRCAATDWHRASLPNATHRPVGRWKTPQRRAPGGGAAGGRGTARTSQAVAAGGASIVAPPPRPPAGGAARRPGGRPGPEQRPPAAARAQTGYEPAPVSELVVRPLTEWLLGARGAPAWRRPRGS